MIKVLKEEYWRGDICPQRERERERESERAPGNYLRGPPGLQLTTQGWEKNHQEGAVKTIP